MDNILSGHSTYLRLVGILCWIQITKRKTHIDYASKISIVCLYIIKPIKP